MNDTYRWINIGIRIGNITKKQNEIKINFYISLNVLVFFFFCLDNIPTVEYRYIDGNEIFHQI